MKKILHFDQDAIVAMDKSYRANLVNSVTGYKSANLIGSISKTGVENLAIFSSVVHIGSDPALLGFILRPPSVPRHTYSNIKHTGVFTVNHVNINIIKAAHQTAARYDEEISEFEVNGLKAYYENNWKAPYLKEAHIKMGCSYVNEYTLKENGTLLIIGAIKQIHLPEHTLENDGWINLEAAQGIAINGLDSYAKPQTINRFAYAKPEKPVTSILRE